MSQFPTRELRAKQAEIIDLQNKAIDSLREKGVLGKYAGAQGDIFQYEKSLAHALINGGPKFDRTGTDTIGIHGYQSRFNLDNGFPLITTKKVFLKSVIHELLWFLRGETNIKYLVENKVTIWSDWPLKYYNQSRRDGAAFGAGMSGSSALEHSVDITKDLTLDEFHQKIASDPLFAKEWGELGPVYGRQWRNWSAFRETKKGYYKKANAADREMSPEEWVSGEYEWYSIDQIQQVVDAINKQHESGVISRRMIVSAWNVADIPAMSKSGLPPCHCLFQFHSRLMTLEERQKYWAKINQKDFSFVQDMDDTMLDEVGAPVYELDLQLYQRSCDIFLGVPFNIACYALILMMMAQVTNTKPGTFIHDYGDFHVYKNHLNQVVEQLSRDARPYPIMTLKKRGQKIDEFQFGDFVLSDYDPHPAISAEVAV